MNEKKILRSNLNIKNENLKYTEDNISILNDLIKNKIICVYIPLKSEIDINDKLFGYQKILTTYLDNKTLKICKYKKPFKKK